MTPIYRITLLLLALLPALPQDRQPTGVCRLETKYDRSADTTTIQCELMETGAPPVKLTIRANASFQGKEPNETAKFWLGLWSYQGRATRRTQPLFQEATTLYLSAGLARLEIPVKDYRKDFFELNGLLTEQASAEISPEDLRKLLDARSLEGKWGGVEFKFSEATLAMLKGFISRQVFAANDR